MKRLGLRKVADKAIDTKAGKVSDKIVSAIVHAPGTISRKLGLKPYADAAKINVVKMKQNAVNAKLNKKFANAKDEFAILEAKDNQECDLTKEEMKRGFAEMKEAGVDVNAINNMTPEDAEFMMKQMRNEVPTTISENFKA